MMMLKKMVIRNRSSGSSLGGWIRGIRSIANNKEQEEEEEVVCLSVRCGREDLKLRWYCIAPPVSACDGGGVSLIKSMSTNGPSLLCEIKGGIPPLSFAALNSKIHIIWGTGTQSLPDDKLLLKPLEIDTSSRQITVREGSPMITCQRDRNDFPSAVTLDGKLYVFPHEALGQRSYCEVFDPTTNQWQALSTPSDECLKGRVFNFVAYEKEKKILFDHFDLGVCAYDLSTNSWEYGRYPVQSDDPYGTPQLSKLLSMNNDYNHNEGHYVIQGDFLYMFLEGNIFYAYDLKNKKLHEVCGLGEHTDFLYYSVPYSIYQSVFLLQLGKEELCLVCSQGPLCGGLNVVCLKFYVEKIDDTLCAVLLSRDYYSIDEARCLEGCVAIKRPGLGTSAVSCSFDPDNEEQEGL